MEEKKGISKKIIIFVFIFSILLLFLIIFLFLIYTNEPAKVKNETLDGGEVSLTYTDDENVFSINSSTPTSDITGKKYNYSSPSEFGYIFPVQGCSKSNINKLVYPSYAGHTGVDVNINVKGKNVVTVKDGTVVKSLALKRSDGSYRSYGEYIVINHHDGTMTLYAHMLEGSRKVFEGNKVSKEQVIEQ